MTDLDKRIDRHASLMQFNHAIGNFALAMRHCRIFTTLARRRAAPLFNDGTGAPGLLNSDQQARRHPIKSELRLADGASEGKP